MGSTAQKIGRRMKVNYGGEVVATYNLPQNIDSLTFETYNIYTVTATPSDENLGTAEASATEVEEGATVTITAIPNEEGKFVNWTLNGEVVSTENPYTATVTANTEFVANFEEFIPEYVDLGLPSGIKWATCNVGATTPEGYGDYFAWGETQPKDYYDWSTYKYCNGSSTTMTKYCIDSSYGTVDNKTVLELEDDAAHVNWGGNWRMPTKAEQEELIDTNNCTWKWTTQNGVEGYKVISKKNGNSIFLPAAGCRNGDDLVTAGSNGFYWSSSLYTGGSDYAFGVYFSSNVNLNRFSRFGGASVRAVCGSSMVYTVTVSATEGGTVEASATEVEHGGMVTLTATPNESYKFVNWTVNGEVVSTKNPYTVIVTSDIEYVANFEEGELEYCTYEGNSTNYERRLNALTITDGINPTKVSSIQPNFRGAVYVDKTDVVFPTFAGATVDFSEFDFKGEWMHAFVYIDYNNDKVFDTTVNADGTTGGELVSFTFYSATDSGTGVNSLGETVSNYTIPMVDYLPAFTLPADLEDGDYRVRVKIDWSHLDPCGHPTENANKLTTNGGAMVDITIRIVNLPARTISVSVNDEAMGTAYVGEEGTTTLEGQTGAIKLVAVANEGYEFVNWTLNGEVISTDATIYDLTEGDKEYVANFIALAMCNISVSVNDEIMGTASASQTGEVFKYTEVTLTATPNNGYKFANWTVNGEVVSTENPYTATVTANTEFVANFEEFIPEYVDLGLPSGIKWATCNVGATTPEEYGDYFAWGETEPKDNYSWSTYKYCNGTYDTMTKYCTDSEYGTVDNKTVLELEDDAAHVIWGGNWRMPTKAEQDELRNTNNCTWEWTTQNGVNGYKVTSVVNGNSIFLPAAGYRGGGNLFAGSYGGYWSSSLYSSNSNEAYFVYFNSSDVSLHPNNHCLGRSVRAVCE